MPDTTPPLCTRGWRDRWAALAMADHGPDPPCRSSTGPSMTDIDVTEMEPGHFGVQVEEGTLTTSRRVSVSTGFIDDLQLGEVDPVLIVQESVAFLLDRVPATACHRRSALTTSVATTRSTTSCELACPRLETGTSARLCCGDTPVRVPSRAAGQRGRRRARQPQSTWGQVVLRPRSSSKSTRGGLRRWGRSIDHET